MKRFTYPCLLALAIAAFPGCGSSSSDGDVIVDGPSQDFGSICGIVVNNEKKDAPEDKDLTFVDIEPIRSDIIAATLIDGNDAGGQVLVKLHGVTADGADPRAVQRGVELIRSRFQSGFMVPAGPGCTTTVAGGGSGQLAQIFSELGENLNEALLAAGAVVPTADACGGNLLTSCYAGVPQTDNISDEVISDFLWKPQSERDGNLVILVNPFNATVIVNGVTLSDTGPSNGRGTTARANRSGCAFGANARVEFFDSEGRRILVADGRREVVIPDGCARVEFVL